MPTPGRYQLLVRVHATSVNPVDAKVRHGGGASRAFPIVLGYDASGVVVARGPDVEGWRDQDEVFGCPNLFGPGANAEYVLLDARAAAKKPATLDHPTTACLPLVSLTAWEALHDRARLQPGQTVLIHAGAGGVGHVAIQLARLHGCRVITTAGRAESIAFCRDVLGADEVIDYRSVDFAARCKKLTGGRGVDVALDTVGDDTFRRSIDCVAPGGQLVTILAATPGDRAPLLLYRSISVHYEFMGARVANGLDPGHQGRILTSIARLVDRGLLRVHVGARFALEQVGDAHRQIETGRTIGKLAVVIV
ncbi:MAG TPA: zinc-binding dehydrogenase [Polyangia bacterium]|nr:zinc-binding dehydrogenase [Polyangia bacterium]